MLESQHVHASMPYHATVMASKAQPGHLCLCGSPILKLMSKACWLVCQTILLSALI